MQVPEVFYKDKFCKAVTGRTDGEWRDAIARQYGLGNREDLRQALQGLVDLIIHD